ncbi:hypothetical protein CSB08_00610 [Candidatus Gracilibacteria bacterium]|nr:MAG: hypothetical protein CSB08_00610 [Candidatus Gracilibacteria bacterium]PIE84877.1 MAG: hypothetical protein CSA08_04945 [Candidatus Gracilibacteria bacterium]
MSEKNIILINNILSLEDFEQDIESSESGNNSGIEVSEKFKESFKKSTSGIKRTKKDEKKAKKYDFLLANFLVKIILDKKFSPIIEPLLKSLKAGYPSNFILGIISLVKIEISDNIREISGKEKIEFSYLPDKIIEFDDNNVDSEIRNRINFWIEDIIDITSIEYSSLVTKQIIDLLGENDKIILDFTKNVFTFFLFQLNININSKKSENISKFILNDLKKSLNNLKIEEI